jgi:hypothetical protein
MVHQILVALDITGDELDELLTSVTLAMEGAITARILRLIEELQPEGLL